MSTISERLIKIKSKLPQEVTLIAVSKTKPNESIQAAYEAGHREFGENYVQELCDKHLQLPDSIHWHFIGHLQSNKVKYIAPFVYLIHGVDSLSVLKEINKQGKKNKRVISCLLQVYIASEETKFGFDANEIRQIYTYEFLAEYTHVKICGLMAMASNTEDRAKLENEFSGLHDLFLELKSKAIPNAEMGILSCGMSSDYELALKYGSNMIRIGSSIFGERDYSNRRL
jgi:PLP dependent protein